MSNYTMPVLSEKEREALISLAKIEVKRWKSCADQQRGFFMAELMEIALAALTATAIGKVNRGEHDDCGSYPDAKVVCLHDQADWDNFADGTLLYLIPPVPVKQEGEQ